MIKSVLWSALSVMVDMLVEDGHSVSEDSEKRTKIETNHAEALPRTLKQSHLIIIVVEISVLVSDGPEASVAEFWDAGWGSLLSDHTYISTKTLSAKHLCIGFRFKVYEHYRLAL